MEVSNSTTAGARSNGLVRVLGHPGFWALWVVLIFSASITRAVVDSRVEPIQLPVYGSVPEFQLTDQHGQSWGSDRLHGRVWMASFLFTRCPTICPRLTQKIGEVQHRSRAAGDAFHLVSFSVDPEYDTPPVLLEYSRKYRASQGMWTFLTGAPGEVEKTVVEGMKISMGRSGTFEESLVDPNSIFHGTKVALIDQHMQIRGYYDLETEALQPEERSEMDVLLGHINHLINAGPEMSNSARTEAKPQG